MSKPTLQSLNMSHYPKQEMCKASYQLLAGDGSLKGKLKKYMKFKFVNGEFLFEERVLVATEDVTHTLQRLYNALETPTVTALGNIALDTYVGISRTAVSNFYKTIEKPHDVAVVNNIESVTGTVNEDLLLTEESVEEKKVMVAFKIGQSVRIKNQPDVYKVTRQRHMRHTLSDVKTSNPIKGKTFYSYELEKI